jgi:hypothetical protein
VGFVPIDVIGYVDTIEIRVKADVLNEFGVLPRTNDPDRGPNRSLLDQLNGVGFIQNRNVLLEVGVDVPCVVVFRSVLECLNPISVQVAVPPTRIVCWASGVP